MPPVRSTVATIPPAIVRICKTGSDVGWVRLDRIADAMRPRVVPAYSRALAYPALNGSQQAVIGCRAPIIMYLKLADELAVLRLLEEELAALIGISKRGARIVAHPLDSARSAGNVHSWIQRSCVPCMKREPSEVARRHEPVGRNLSLDGEIPRRLGRPVYIVVLSQE